MRGPTPENRIFNLWGQEILPGMKVDRLDGYKRGGQVLQLRTEQVYWRHPVLVRWPTETEEWCSAELLQPRKETIN